MFKFLKKCWPGLPLIYFIESLDFIEPILENILHVLPWYLGACILWWWFFVPLEKSKDSAEEKTDEERDRS